jgi:hypothetical protein
MSDANTYSWWFGEDALPVSSVAAQAEWKEHPFDVLEGGKGLTLYRRDSRNQIEQRDAAPTLTAFACYEAGELVHLWNVPQVVQEYLQTGSLGLSGQAAIAVREALDEAELERQIAEQLVEAAKAKCPKLGFFARAATRAAAWTAAQDYAKAVAAYHHRGAVLYAIGTALLATVGGTPDGAWLVADAAIDTAGMLAAQEGVIIASNSRPKPELLPPGVAQATGRLAATVNIRARFSAMVNQLFSCES